MISLKGLQSHYQRAINGDVVAVWTLAIIGGGLITAGVLELCSFLYHL